MFTSIMHVFSPSVWCSIADWIHLLIFWLFWCSPVVNQFLDKKKKSQSAYILLVYGRKMYIFFLMYWNSKWRISSMKVPNYYLNQKIVAISVPVSNDVDWLVYWWDVPGRIVTWIYVAWQNIMMVATPIH